VEPRELDVSRAPATETYTTWDGVQCPRTPCADLPGAGCRRVTVDAWRLAKQDVAAITVVDDSDLVGLDVTSLAVLSAQGLDGVWTAIGYEVVGPEGHVEVTVHVDENGVLQAIIEPTDIRDFGTDVPLLAAIPKA
jgi:hypothetical protein